MLQIIGTVSNIQRELVEPVGRDPFTSTTIVLVSDEGNTDYVRVGSAFPESQMPEQGERVTLAVWPRPYVNKTTDKLGCGFTAYRLVQAPSLV